MLFFFAFGEASHAKLRTYKSFRCFWFIVIFMMPLHVGWITLLGHTKKKLFGRPITSSSKYFLENPRKPNDCRALRKKKNQQAADLFAGYHWQR